MHLFFKLFLLVTVAMRNIRNHQKMKRKYYFNFWEKCCRSETVIKTQKMSLGKTEYAIRENDSVNEWKTTDN